MFLQNNKDIKKEVTLGYDLSFLLSSFLYTDLNLEVDLNKLKESHKILRKKTGVFSDYRFLDLLLSTKMSLSDDPNKYFENIDKVYKRVNTKRLLSSVYSIVSSIIINDYNIKDDEIDNVIEKEKVIYEKMKKSHPYLTDVDDIPFTILLSLNRKDNDPVVDEIEECYNILKDNVKASKNDLYSIAQIICISEKNYLKNTNKFLEIYNLLKENKKHVADGFYLTVLSTLIFIDCDIKKLVEDIIEVDNYIGCQKGLGLWSYGKSTRLLFAIILVESVYGDKINNNNTTTAAFISYIVTENLLITLMILNLAVLD